MRVVLAFSALLAVASATCLPLAERSATLDRVSMDLQANGFGSLHATFSFFNVQQCAVLPTCYLQNPTSPYGFIQAPNNPAQPVYPYTLPLLATNSSYRLAPTEALILTGCTPPTSRYMGFTPYVTWHYNAASPLPEANKWTNIFGSMSDTLNQATLKTFPDGPWSANTIIIVTASETTFAALAPIIASRFGVAVSGINVLALPAAAPIGLSMGYGLHNDLFSFLFRQAIAENQADYQAWEASTPFSVLRVWYHAPPATPVLYGMPTLRPRNTAITEVPYQAAYNTLVSSTLTRLAGRFNVNVIPYTPNLLGFASADWGGVCYVSKVPCAGDNRDSTYLTSNITLMFQDPTDQYIVVGANHENTGTAVYSNVVDYNYARGVGLTDVIDTQYAGSADVPVPNYANPAGNGGSNPAQPQFYMWKYARTCQPLDTHCSTIASTGYPDIPANGAGIFMTRAYEASAIHASPAAAVLIKPTVLHLVDRCRPQACDATTCHGLPNYKLYDIAFGSHSVSQSSTLEDLVAANAVDGLDGFFDDPASTKIEYQPYWQIDLGFSRNVHRVQLKGFLGRAYVMVSDTPFTARDLHTAKQQATAHWYLREAVYEDIKVDKSFRYMRIQDVSFGTVTLAKVGVEAYCSTV